MSLEDLRDNYKNLRQNSDLKLKLNGATYRKVRNEFSSAKMGNTIKKLEHDAKVSKYKETNDLDDLNKNYFIGANHLEFSLNKKKRWEITGELVDKMDTLAQEDIDVRLYETRNRFKNKSNCIGVHKSMGDKISVKGTYANLDSIKKKQQLDETAKRNKALGLPDPNVKPVAIKSKKCSKPKLKLNDNNIETIVIDDNIYDDEEDTSYTQYEVQYAPKKDILKFDAKRYSEKETFSKQSKTAFERLNSLSDSELYKIDRSELSETEEDFENEESEEQLKKTDQISLDDLINKYADDIFKKQIEKVINETKVVEDKPIVLDKKDRKVYVNKEDVISESSQEKANKSINKKSAKPIPISVQVKNDSIQTDRLKEKYGIKYSEAYNCWPKNFSLNLNDEIKLNMSKSFKNKPAQTELDIVAWLVFQELANETNENSAYVTTFNVSLCTNLICKSIQLENVNPSSCWWNVDDLYQKAVEFITDCVPFESFRTKDSSKPFVSKLNNTLVNDIPTIGGEKKTHDIDDLKLRMLKHSISILRESEKDVEPKGAEAENLNRANSIEVVKKDEVADADQQRNVQDKLEKILANKKFECILCFDEKTNLNDCTIIKSCAHCVCNACMKDYVDSNLENMLSKAGRFKCPACDVNLELALMISFASNGNQMDNFIKMSVERIIFVLSSYKWCPSASCGKVIQVDLNSNPYGTVSCTCGFKMCLKCNNAPHFPAKCSQVSNYYEELNGFNDFHDPEDSTVTSEGRRCPNCNTFIEKNGGCNHMNCSMCFKEFCWNCGMTWADHLKHTNNNYSCIKSKPDSVIKVEFTKIRKAKAKDKSYRYQDSLVHRQKRTAKAKKEMLVQARRLLDKIKFDVDVDDIESSTASSRTEKLVEYNKKMTEKKENVKSFFDQMVTFLNEMHFICEHAYVLLRDASIDKDVRGKISNLINSFEVVIWRIENIFLNGNDNGCVDQLKNAHEKGIELIKKLNKIQPK